MNFPDSLPTTIHSQGSITSRNLNIRICWHPRVLERTFELGEVGRTETSPDLQMHGVRRDCDEAEKNRILGSFPMELIKIGLQSLPGRKVPPSSVPSFGSVIHRIHLDSPTQPLKVTMLVTEVPWLPVLVHIPFAISLCRAPARWRGHRQDAADRNPTRTMSVPHASYHLRTWPNMFHSTRLGSARLFFSLSSFSLRCFRPSFLLSRVHRLCFELVRECAPTP